MSERANQSTLLRIKFLENDIQNYKADLARLTDANEVVLMQEKIKDREVRINENKQWLRVLEADPGWGEMVEVETGKYIPKMPTFKSQQEMEFALDHPENWYEEDEGDTEQHYMATREMVNRNHNELALQRMDGEGTIAAEERESSGPQNDES